MISSSVLHRCKANSLVRVPEEDEDGVVEPVAVTAENVAAPALSPTVRVDTMVFPAASTVVIA